MESSCFHQRSQERPLWQASMCSRLNWVKSHENMWGKNGLERGSPRVFLRNSKVRLEHKEHGRDWTEMKSGRWQVRWLGGRDCPPQGPTAKLRPPHLHLPVSPSDTWFHAPEVPCMFPCTLTHPCPRQASMHLLKPNWMSHLCENLWTFSSQP